MSKYYDPQFSFVKTESGSGTVSNWNKNTRSSSTNSAQINP